MVAKLTVDLSGPFFTRDPEKTMNANIRRMLEGVASEGERLAQSAWSVDTGAGQRGTVGRVASITGKPWRYTAVVSAQHVYPWPSGGAKQYRGGKVEARVHMFRRTASALRRSRAILTANLTAGLE